MTLRQRLENLPVGRKLLIALLVLLAALLLVSNLLEDDCLLSYPRAWALMSIFEWRWVYSTL